MKLLYFAWVREKIGKAEETATLPQTVRSVADLLAWQKSRGPEYEAAFANESVIRIALDQSHAKSDEPVGAAREIAFFPPVTGG